MKGARQDAEHIDSRLCLCAAVTGTATCSIVTRVPAARIEHLETGTGSRSGHTRIGTVDTKGSAGTFATMHIPSVATASYGGHNRVGIGDCIDDIGSCCRSTALYCLADVARGRKRRIKKR